jgi:hypothetical protein
MNCLFVGLLLSLVTPLSPASGPVAVDRPVLATQFSAVGDPWNPNPELACNPGRDLDDARDVIVAHRTLPCGTRVKVCVVRSGACVEARVADRLGRCSHGRCSQLDLAPATARLLRRSRRRGWNGMEMVTVKPMPRATAGDGDPPSLWSLIAGSASVEVSSLDLGSALQRLVCDGGAPRPPEARGAAAMAVHAAP